MNKEIIEKAGKIIAKNTGESTHCVLGLVDLDGYPTASTITVSKSDGVNWMTFCTGLRSTKSERIRNNNHACVCFSAEEYNITLVGTIEIVTDTDVKKDMWYDGMSNHFSGPDDPEYCILRFKTQRYNLLVDWNEVAGVL